MYHPTPCGSGPSTLSPSWTVPSTIQCMPGVGDHQLKMHDSNTDQENLVGTHNAPIRCVDYSPEVSVMVTGSWDQTVQFWDPRTPNAGSFSRPQKMYPLSVTGEQAARGPCRPQGVGVGPREHGLRAARGVQHEAPSSLHTSRATYRALLKAERQLRYRTSMPSSVTDQEKIILSRFTQSMPLPFTISTIHLPQVVLMDL